MSKSIAVLSTKVLHANQRVLMQNSAIDLMERDFIGISILDFEFEELHDCLLITSQNAVKSLLQHPNRLALMQKPVFCVGIKTKELLEHNGWRIVEWAHYAIDLAPIITADYPQLTFSFFNGNLRSEVLPKAFLEAAVIFNEFQVYKTELTPLQVEQPLMGICFYSPSGVASYLQRNQIGEAVCFCIGNTTANALEGIAKRVVLASHPTVEATLEACVNYYK